MRVLFWYCEKFDWVPALKTLEDAPSAVAAENSQAVVAFVHVEPEDTKDGSSAETKLVKNSKWLARKWETKKIVLHSFTHLGDAKAEADEAKDLLESAQKRLETAGYETLLTPYGYFLDLDISAPGHPLARVYKAF
jgi:hypothetical protein